MHKTLGVCEINFTEKTQNVKLPRRVRHILWTYLQSGALCDTIMELKRSRISPDNPGGKRLSGIPGKLAAGNVRRTHTR